MQWKNDVAIFIQVVELFKQDVILGKYKLGQKIPSVRDFAFSLQINPNTIAKVYDILSSEGLIVSKSTTGYFLTENEEIISSLKPQFAKKYCDEFLEKMKSIGYSIEETITYLGEGI